MRTIHEIRRANLDLVLQNCCAGSRSQLAMRLGMSRSQLSQLFTQYRSIGDAVARRIETACQLPAGWMDMDHPQDADEEVILTLFRRLRDPADRRRAVSILQTLAS